MRISREQQCSDCGRYDNRGVSVDAVIQRAGKLLLIKRGSEPFKGFWALPGGFVGWDETVEQAVAREVAEETTLTATRTTQMPVLSDPARHPRQVINIPFIVEAEGQPVAGDDALEVAWFGWEELPSELAFDHEQIVLAALQQLRGGEQL